MGAGALVGDLIKSFFKRKLKIDEGNAWFPFDQIDWIIGAYVFSFPLFNLYELVFLLMTGIVLHIIANFIAVRFGLKNSF